MAHMHLMPCHSRPSSLPNTRGQGEYGCYSARPEGGVGAGMVNAIV
jgi:hypothetical protein